MKKAFFSLTLLFVMLCVSCTDVPEDVKSRTEAHESRVSAAAEDSKALEEQGFDPKAKVPLEEVKKELEGYSFKKHDNLAFKCVPEPIAAENVYDIKMTYGLNTEAGKEDFERMKALNKTVFDRDIPDSLIQVNYYSKDMVEAVDNDNCLNYGMLSHGSPSFELYNFDNDLIESVTDIVLESFSLDSYPKDAVKMIHGGEFTVDKAIEQADGILKKLEEINAFDKGETHKLSHIGVGDYQGKGNMIVVHYSQCRYGIPVEDANVCTSQTRTSFFEVWFYGDNDPFVITNFCSGYETESSALDDIIPLSGAEVLAADGLAPEMVYDVTDAELRYLCLWDINDLKEVIEYHPVWCFTLEELPEIWYGRYFERKMLYVDAVTGELYFCDPTMGLFLTSEEMKPDEEG